MRKLLKYLKGYEKETILGPLFKLVEAVFELAVPLVVANIIDNGIRQGNWKSVLLQCLLLVGLAVAGLAFSVTAQYFSAVAAVGFATKLRHALFERVQQFSYSQLDTLGTSSLITRMTSDINTVQNGVNMMLRLFLRSPFIVFGAAVMAFVVDPHSAMTFVVVIPALCIVVFAIILASIPLYEKVQRRLEGVLGATRENLGGARVIRAFCAENREKKSFKEKNKALLIMQKAVGRISALMNPLTYVVINLGIIALLWVGAGQVNGGIITTGAVLALYNYMSQILVELVKMANLVIMITKSFASAARVEETLAVQPDRPALTGGSSVGMDESGVHFEDAALRYSGAGEDSLSHISFSAALGETVGVIGGTGSGKTSLMHLIPGFYLPTEGQVYVNGTATAAWDRAQLLRQIAVVPQKAVLFSGTIRDNMLWGDPAADDETIWKALEVAQADQVVRDKGGLDAVVEQGGRNFSGGQRQRLTIARALVRAPKILILDDSASALDHATEAALRAAIGALSPKPLVFIVSQRASSVMHADQILVLDDGTIAGKGTHEELLESCQVYQEIYRSQFGSQEESA